MILTDAVHLIGAPEWGAETVDLLAGNRTARWRFELLDSRNRTIGELSGVRDFSAEFNLHTTIRSGGSLTYQGTEPIDWRTHRVRAYYGAENRGRVKEWAVGTFIVESPESTVTDQSRTSVDLQLFDMTYRLDRQTSTARAWTGRRGTNIIDRLRVLLDRQQMVHALEDSDAVFGSDMSWPAGTPYLRMANDMLKAAGFFSIHADPMGVLRASPYQAPQSRGVSFEFRDDQTGTPYLPVFTVKADDYNVPGQVIAVAASDDPDAAPVVATATSYTGPFSFAERGIRISTVETDVPAADQAALQAYAERRLEELQRVSTTIEFQHLPLPLGLNDVVTLERPGHGISARAVVEKFTYSQDVPGVSSTTIREVAA